MVLYNPGAPQSPVVKVGTFVNNTANGVQAITGVGFAPDYLIIYQIFQGLCVVFASGTSAISIRYDSGGGLGITGNDLMVPYTGVNDMINGVVTSLDADGFTITWSGLQGTAPARTFYYLALKR